MEKHFLKEEISPINDVLKIMSGKWNISIMSVLCSNKVIRYNELKRQVNGITGTMLNQSLKDMISFGIIDRTQYNEMPMRVEYTLTEAGKELSPIVAQLFEWSKQNR